MHFLALRHVVVMVLLHLLFYHLKLLKLVQVCQLLLISLDSFIEAVDLHFLFAKDIHVHVSLRVSSVVEVLGVDILARVLLLRHCWVGHILGTLIDRLLLFYFFLFFF